MSLRAPRHNFTAPVARPAPTKVTPPALGVAPLSPLPKRHVCRRCGEAFAFARHLGRHRVGCAYAALVDCRACGTGWPAELLKSGCPTCAGIAAVKALPIPESWRRHV